MRIAIDARWIYPEISGIGNYTRELIRHLALLDRDNSYLLLFDNASVRDRTAAEAQLHDKGNVSSLLLGYGLFSAANQILLPRALARERADLFHSTNYMIPLLAFPRGKKPGAKCVVTVHDVIPMIFPDHAPKSRKARFYPIYRRLMTEVGSRADVVITDSRASRVDVIKHLRISGPGEDKVRVIYCGVSERFRSSSEPVGGARRVAAAPGTPRTVLYVGRPDPYKNLPVLVEAVARARQMCPFPLTLKIAGAQDPRYPDAMRRAEALGIRDAVCWTGYLADDELVRAYRQADVLAHPSRYEGFGLQVVEAMACGLPVICSNKGSLPEVAGDAAIMLEPDDVEGFARRITEVLTNPVLSEELSEKGRRQAARFTWTDAARQTLALYAECVAPDRPSPCRPMRQR